MEAQDQAARPPQLHRQWTLQERFRLKGDPALKVFRGKVWIVVKDPYTKRNEYLYNNQTLLGPVLRTIADGEIAQDGTMYPICLLLLRPGAFVLYKDVAHLCWEHTSNSNITILRTRNTIIRPDLLAGT